MSKLIFLGDTEIILQSPFVRDEVNALQKAVPSARWDRLARVWRIPVMDRKLAVAYADTWGYDVSEDLIRLQLPDTTPPPNIVTTPKGVVMSFAYDPVKIKVVKDIPNSRWHAASKTWRAPMSSLVEVVDFAKEYRLVVSDDTAAEAERVKANRQRMMELSRATDGVITIPNFGLELYPYQRAGVAYAVDKLRTFIADDTGLGKTAEAMATVQHTGTYPCLVVVPPSLLLDWGVKLAEALPDKTVTLVRKRGELPEHDTDFTVIGWSNIAHHADALELRSYKAAIFDESQAYKNYKALRTKAAIQLAHSIPADGVVLLLTGTPITSRPTEYEPQLDMLGVLKLFGGRWGFFKRFCGAYQDAGKQWHMDGAIPKGRLKELNDLLRQVCFVRRLKGDVLTDLPPIIDDYVYVELSPAWSNEYAKAESDIVKYFANLKAEIAEELGENVSDARIRARIAAKAGEHLVRIAVLRKITALGKVDAANEWIATRTGEGNKVIIAAHHKDVTSAMAATNGGLRIVGGQTAESVEEDKEAFQTLSCAEAPTITLSIQAAKMGHTLTASSRVILMELPWNPADEYQVISRAHRIGQTDVVQATRMLAKGTIDEKIANILKRKRLIVREATDGILPEEKNTNFSMEIIDNFL